MQFQKRYQSTTLPYSNVEKWKLSNDKGDSFEVLLTDLSKEFECLSLELLIAKLTEYSFSLSALKLMYTYLPFR